MLTRDLFRSAPIADSKRFEEESISSDSALIRASDCYNSLVLPEERLTDWMRVSVRATLAVLPSQTSCQESVFLRRSRASTCLPSLDWQVALLRQMSWTSGLPSRLKGKDRLTSLCSWLSICSAFLQLPFLMVRMATKLRALKYSSRSLSFSDSSLGAIWSITRSNFSSSPRCMQSSARWISDTSFIFSDLQQTWYSFSEASKSPLILSASALRMLQRSMFSSDSLVLRMASTLRLQTSRLSLQQPESCRSVAWLSTFTSMSSRQSQLRMRSNSILLIFSRFSLCRRRWFSGSAPYRISPRRVLMLMSSTRKTLQMLQMTLGCSPLPTTQPKSRAGSSSRRLGMTVNLKAEGRCLSWALASFSLVYPFMKEVKRMKCPLAVSSLAFSSSVTSITMWMSSQCFFRANSALIDSNRSFNASRMQASRFGSVVFRVISLANCQQNPLLKAHSRTRPSFSSPSSSSLQSLANWSICWASWGKRWWARARKSCLAWFLLMQCVLHWQLRRYLLSSRVSSSTSSRLLGGMVSESFSSSSLRAASSWSGSTALTTLLSAECCWFLPRRMTWLILDSFWRQSRSWGERSWEAMTFTISCLLTKAISCLRVLISGKWSTLKQPLSWRSMSSMEASLSGWIRQQETILRLESVILERCSSRKQSSSSGLESYPPMQSYYYKRNETFPSCSPEA